MRVQNHQHHFHLTECIKQMVSKLSATGLQGVQICCTKSEKGVQNNQTTGVDPSPGAGLYGQDGDSAIEPTWHI